MPIGPDVDSTKKCRFIVPSSGSRHTNVVSNKVTSFPKNKLTYNFSCSSLILSETIFVSDIMVMDHDSSFSFCNDQYEYILWFITCSMKVDAAVSK